MNETRQLAEFVTTTSYSDLPTGVLDKMRGYVLDNLACGLAGAGRPEPRLLADYVRSASADGQSFVFGASWRTFPSFAALVNGTAISALESDHGYIPGSCHPGAAVFPAVLAIGQPLAVDGKQLLTALVLGYEAQCRIGVAATRSVEDQRGFHGPGTNAAFGAAIATSKLLGLDKKATASALGIAGSHAGGLLEFVHEGAMTKRLHVGRGSQVGLESALFAQRGLTGPSTVLEGRFGFLNAYSATPRPEELLRDLGRRWHLEDLLVRPFPCHGSFHGIVEVLSRFRAEHRPDLERITALVIRTSEATIARHGDKSPATVTGMQYSMPFCAALALACDIGDPRVVSEETVQDPAIRALAGSVQFEGVATQEGGQYQHPRAEVTLEVEGKAHRFDVDGYKGHPTTPCTWDDMVDKLFRFVGPILGEQRVREVVKRVGALETLKGPQELVALLS